MFEKEAKENAHKKYPVPLNWDSIDLARNGKYEEGFKDGAEFGYNKANEWHYPSKGELPKEDTAEKETIYLLCFGLDDSDYMTGLFSYGRFWCFDNGWFETNEVIAWKELVSPELPKESE